MNLNRAFRRSVTGMTPYEAWYPRTFGYVAHVHEERASSPEEAGRPEHANGLQRLRERHQGLPCLRSRRQMCARTRNVVFDEDASWDWRTHEENPVSTAFTVDCYVHSTRLHCVPLHLRWQARTRLHCVPLHRSPSTPAPAEHTSPAASSSRTELASPTPEAEAAPPSHLPRREAHPMTKSAHHGRHRAAEHPPRRQKGYVKQQGIDVADAFGPVARLESVRLLLALAAHRGWVCWPGALGDAPAQATLRTPSGTQRLDPGTRIWTPRSTCSASV